MRPTPMKAIFSPTRNSCIKPETLSLAAPRPAASDVRIEIQTHRIGKTGSHRGISRQYQGIVPRNHVLRRTRQRLDGSEGIEIGRDIVDYRKWPPLLPIGVEVRRVRRQHHPA